VRGFTRYIDRDSTDQIESVPFLKRVMREEGVPMEVRDAQLETPITPLCPEYVRYRPSIPASYHKADWLSRGRSRIGAEVFEDLQMRDVMLDFQFGEKVPREICNHEASESIGIQM
jgi:hypothetical protein